MAMSKEDIRAILSAHEERPSELIPRDAFSKARRSHQSDPAALSATSTVDVQDDYGNIETWVVETWRDGHGADTVLLQHTHARGGNRAVLPPAVTSALARHREQIYARAKRRQGHRLIAQRKERGDRLGNPEALKKARRKKSRG